MAKYTEHLRLVKPEGNEYYNVEQFNQNSELIDKETKRLSEGLSKVQEGATKDKKGIVQFGTEEGKALEGMMLARMFGCVGYGGDIQDPGSKNVNYVYFDRNTRKMYKCLNQNSDVSANVANFIPLDNNSLLDRLENLIKMKVLYNLQVLDTNPTEFYLSESVLNYDFIVISAKVKGYNMYSSYFFESVAINNRIINLANDDDAASYYSINGTHIKLNNYTVANWVIYRVLGIKMS